MQCPALHMVHLGGRECAVPKTQEIKVLAPWNLKPVSLHSLLPLPPAAGCLLVSAFTGPKVRSHHLCPLLMPSVVRCPLAKTIAGPDNASCISPVLLGLPLPETLDSVKLTHALCFWCHHSHCWRSHLTSTAESAMPTLAAGLPHLQPSDMDGLSESPITTKEIVIMKKHNKKRTKQKS